MQSSTPSVTSNLAIGTEAALLAPRVALGSCIQAYFMRSTMDAPPLSERQRLNHFPTSSFATISWMLHGESRLVRRGGMACDQLVPSILFAGPNTEPVVTYNPGPVHVFFLILQPEALHLLTGIDIASYTDCMTPFEQVFDFDWQEMAEQVQQASTHQQRIVLIETFIGALWSAARTRNGMRANWFYDCLNGLAIRALASDFACGARQLERRLKTWTGLSLLQLRRQRRVQDSPQMVRKALESPEFSWADVAADLGFADQSHYCRESRKLTGLSPNELVQCILHEESFWAYRIWSLR
jgi:AraC-like DNA-binding protein